MNRDVTLEKLFYPKSVAIVGASSDLRKLSGQPLRNLLKVGYIGKVYPVNPNVDSIDGIECYDSLSVIGKQVDVAFINLPANLAVRAVEEAANLRIPFAIVAVSGFSETNTEKGILLQNRLKEIAEEKGIRIVGPNCNGIYNVIDRVSIGYNVTHSKVINRGNIAVISHSGALFSSIESLANQYGNIGFSYFVSSGNEVDLTLIEYFDFMVQDDHSNIIALILDGITNPNEFRVLAKKAREKGKHLVALKIGNTETGIQTIMAHSARLAGSSRSYKAFLNECGVIQVDTIEALVATCSVLSNYNYNQRDKSGLAGISTSGAGCALLADMAGQYGLSFPELSTETKEILNQSKGFALPMNPYDIAASGELDFIGKAIGNDESVGFVVFYSTILPTEYIRVKTAEQFSASCKHLNRKPFIVIATGPLSQEEQEIYNNNDILVFDNSHLVFQVIKGIIDANQSYSPINLPEEQLPFIDIYDENAPLYLLHALNIPHPSQITIKDLNNLDDACESIGFPLVIKGISKENTHKSDVGLVWTNVEEKDLIVIKKAIRNLIKDNIVIDSILIQEFIQGEAEILIGINKDPDIGYVMVLGTGGKYTEILDDVETLTLPASKDSIRNAILNTKAGKIINGARNNNLSPDEVVDTAYKLQNLINYKYTNIESFEINPVIVSENGAVAVDARIVQHESNLKRTETLK